MKGRPLIVHVLYRLDTGGMERVMVSVINHTGKRYRHAVVCLAGFGAMRDEIRDTGVPCVTLGKRPGKDWRCHWRLWRLLRRLQPALVQTYNIGALDAAAMASLAGVRRIIHAEHGRDASDPHGRRRRYRLLRRLLQPFITRFVAVSGDLENWLRDEVGIRPRKITCIRNGIDTERYAVSPGLRLERRLLGGFAPPGTTLFANVGRLDAVKDQVGLVRAFHRLRELVSTHDSDLRLVIMGEGAERTRIERQVARLQLEDAVLLLGNREDVATLLSECDVFVLSSLAEGIPLTVLEAMATGLPVVATDVGGVGEVVVHGVTGLLVPPSDERALARALGHYVGDRELRIHHGRSGRVRVQDKFELADMVSAYGALYDALLEGRCHPRSIPQPVGLTKREER